MAVRCHRGKVMAVSQSMCHGMLVCLEKGRSMPHDLLIYSVLAGPLRRSRHRWEDNIKTDVRETGWGNMDWIDLAQDRDEWRALVNMVIDLRVP
jgi:hypothetical protein